LATDACDTLEKAPRESPRRDMPTQLDIARRLLYLEQKLEAFQSLYDDDLAQIHRALAECRKDLLALLPRQEDL
jgi:hypothetical protein